MTTDAKTFPLRQSFPKKARSQPVRRDTKETSPRAPKLMDRLREALRIEIDYWLYSFLYGLKSAKWRLTRTSRNIFGPYTPEECDASRS